MQAKTQGFKLDKNEFIRNPAVLEFLNIPANYAYTERELEQALIDNIQNTKELCLSELLRKRGYL